MKRNIKILREFSSLVSTKSLVEKRTYGLYFYLKALQRPNRIKQYRNVLRTIERDFSISYRSLLRRLNHMIKLGLATKVGDDLLLISYGDFRSKLEIQLERKKFHTFSVWKLPTTKKLLHHLLSGNLFLSITIGEKNFKQEYARCHELRKRGFTFKQIKHISPAMQRQMLLQFSRCVADDCEVSFRTPHLGISVQLLSKYYNCSKSSAHYKKKALRKAGLIKVKPQYLKMKISIARLKYLQSRGKVLDAKVITKRYLKLTDDIVVNIQARSYDKIESKLVRNWNKNKRSISGKVMKQYLEEDYRQFDNSIIRRFTRVREIGQVTDGSQEAAQPASRAPIAVA